MPLMIDLFAGLGGWAEGGLAEGFDVVGFDIERHEYGEHRYPAQLVVQDVLTLHGSQFRNASLIVASPPCQEYSYMAMPWSRAKVIAAEYRSGKRDVADLTRLFDACFRIQREACEAAGRHIPMVVENVRGAQPWVGRARWNFGSFFLWGDVPALMPITRSIKVPTMGAGWYPPGHPKHVPGLAFNTHAERHTRRTAPGNGTRFTSQDCGIEGRKWGPCPGKRFDERAAGNVAAHREGTKNTSGKGQNPDGRKAPGGGKHGWFGDYAEQKARGTISPGRMHGPGSTARKAASAMIARIPFPLARHIARTYREA